MSNRRATWKYAKDATVYLETGEDKRKAMEAAIGVSRFTENIETAFTRSGKSRAEFFIAIKPNLMTASIREESSPVYKGVIRSKHPQCEAKVDILRKGAERRPS